MVDKISSDRPQEEKNWWIYLVLISGWLLIVIMSLGVGGICYYNGAWLFGEEMAVNQMKYLCYFFNGRIWKATIFLIIMLPVIGALLISLLRTKDEQGKLLKISMLYVAIFFLATGVMTIASWNLLYEPVVLYVPLPLLEWAFIGGFTSVLYRLAFQQDKLDSRLYRYIIIKPIVGLVMGGLVFFIALGSSILLGATTYNQLIQTSNTTQTLIDQSFYIIPGTGILLPKYMIYWLCAIAFIGGFSDKFSIDLMERFLSKYLPKQEENTEAEQESPNQDG